jgi:hypothetical protein
MALTVGDIILTDQISIFRTKFNDLVDEFTDFAFDAYSGDLTFAKDFILEGDLTIEGEIYFEQEYLYLNYGETGAGVTLGVAGIRVDRGSSADAILRFEEATDLWKVGLDGGSFTALSLVGHTHDDRYFTETEIGTLIYTKTEVNTLFTNYYTSAEVDTLFTSYYTSAEVDTILEDYIEQDATSAGTPKVFRYQGNVLDDASVDLPLVTNSGFGWVIGGSAEEYSQFIVDADGTVTLISNSTNVVANADTDAKICIGSDAYEPIHIKNRLGGPKNFNVVFWYD